MGSVFGDREPTPDENPLARPWSRVERFGAITLVVMLLGGLCASAALGIASYQDGRRREQAEATRTQTQATVVSVAVAGAVVAAPTTTASVVLRAGVTAVAGLVATVATVIAGSMLVRWLEHRRRLGTWGREWVDISSGSSGRRE